MIEWVPIKDFLNQNLDEDETFLVLRKNSTSPNITNILSFYKDEFLERFTHAAKINIPVEKTLEERFVQHYREEKHIIEKIPNLDGAIISDFAVIAKEHYEGEK